MDVPVHFIVPDGAMWPELRSGPVEIDGARLSQLSGGIRNSWVVRTYYELGIRGCEVTASPEARPDAVNVHSVRDFAMRDFRMDAFYLVPCGDAHRTALANFIVAQNGLRVEEGLPHWVLHWPQPGIVPRDASRPDRISRIGFKGRVRNQLEEFRPGRLAPALAEIGVTYVASDFDDLVGDHDWGDYRDLDAVLAVRNMTVYDASKKPASKLVNAWIAGVVPLLGPEPAFAELRRSPLDYLVIRSPRDVVEAVTRINASRTLFREILEAGARRRHEVREDVIAEDWVRLLNGPVAQAFHRWRRRGALSRFASGVSRLAREKARRKRDRMLSLNGARIMDEGTRLKDA